MAVKKVYFSRMELLRCQSRFLRVIPTGSNLDSLCPQRGRFPRLCRFKICLFESNDTHFEGTY